MHVMQAKTDKSLLTSHAGHNTADVLCDSVQMCNGHGVQQLVLRKTHKRQRHQDAETHTSMCMWVYSVCVY